MDLRRANRLLQERAGKLVVMLAFTAVAGAAFGAGAGSATNDPATCSVTPATSQPFLQWNDKSRYFPAPGGSFETNTPGWHFTGVVQTVDGNESYHVNSASDRRSLSFGPASYAQSPDICVTVHSPSIRLFAANAGASSSNLQVILNYTDKTGKPQSTQVASLTNDDVWRPTAPILFLNKIAPVVGGQGQTEVSFTFRPKGAGKWQIDDVYVDPLKSQ